MFVKCSEAVRGQGTFSSLACNFSESVSRPNSSHSSFHVCISAWLESVCLQKVSSGLLNGVLHVCTCASLGGEIPSEFFHGSECCKHLNYNAFQLYSLSSSVSLMLFLTSHLCLFHWICSVFINSPLPDPSNLWHLAQNVFHYI